MQYRKIWLILLLSTCLSMAFATISESAGTNGFNFLKVVYSARATAMGSAYTAMDKDADAIFFNPASLLSLPESQFKTTFMSYLVDYQGGSLVYGKPVNEQTAYGFQVAYLQSDKMDRTILTPTGDYGGTDGTFGSNDIVFGASLAKKFTEVVHGGASIKYMRESIDSQSASAVAVDLGFTHQPVNPKVKVGVAVRNLGFQLSSFTDSNYKEKLPLIISGGFRYAMNSKWTGVLDILKPSNQNLSGRVGLEYLLTDMFAIRAGYKSNASDWKSGGDFSFFSGMSGGLGFTHQNLGIDYSISSYGDLGAVNQVSLRYRF